MNEPSLSERSCNPRIAIQKSLPRGEDRGVAAILAAGNFGFAGVSWGCEWLAETSNSDPRLYAVAASRLSMVVM